MVLDAVANFVRGTAAESIDNSQTTIAVADASIFPDPSTQGEFNVVIWDAPNFPRPDQDPDVEIMRVTATDTGTNTLTVTRGQEMTSAAAHPNGSAIHLSPTAKMFSDIESTFADFWDASTQELTADVDNQSVSTGNLSIAESGVIDHGAVSGGGTSTITVSFDQSFGTAPVILHEVGTTASYSLFRGSVRNVSASSFSSTVENTGVSTVDADHCSWAALKPF